MGRLGHPHRHRRRSTTSRLGRASAALLNQEVRRPRFLARRRAQLRRGPSRADAGSTGAIGVWAGPGHGGRAAPLRPGAARGWTGRATGSRASCPARPRPATRSSSPRRSARTGAAGSTLAPPGITQPLSDLVAGRRCAHLTSSDGAPPDRTDVCARSPQPASDPAADDRARRRGSATRLSVDRRTLLYLATAPDGTGPWIHVLDLGREASRRLALGVERYASLAASADGQRLVAT